MTLTALVKRVFLSLSRSRRIDGLWVGCFLSNDPVVAIDRVEQALRLIKAHDPLRYRRLLRDVERIWVDLLLGSWGEFRSELKLCALDERFVLANETRIAQIAAAIVHEATHARLIRCGIGYEPERRVRIEAVCFRREMAFAAKLPDGAQIRDEGERRLAGYPAEYWTPPAFAERRDRGAADALRYLGRSEFFIRAAFRLRDTIMLMRALFRRPKRRTRLRP